MDFRYLTQSGIKESMGKLLWNYWIKNGIICLPRRREFKKIISRSDMNELFTNQNLINDFLNMKTFPTKLMPPIDWPFALDAFKCVGNSK